MISNQAIYDLANDHLKILKKRIFENEFRIFCVVKSFVIIQIFKSDLHLFDTDNYRNVMISFI